MVFIKLYSDEYITKARYFMFKLMNLNFFCKYIVESMPATCKVKTTDFMG